MSVTTPDAIPVPAPAVRKPRGPVVEFIRQQPLGSVSFVIIIAMMFAGIFSEWVAPYDPLAQDFALFQPPNKDATCLATAGASKSPTTAICAGWAP